MANFDLLDKAVKLSEQGFTAEQINKIIDEDIKRMSEDKKPEDDKKHDSEDKKPPENDKNGDSENKKSSENEKTGDSEVDDENKKRVKELEEQLKKAQEKARRTGDEVPPEEKEKKAYDTLLSKIKNY